MSSYSVATQDDWERIARDENTSLSDTVVVTGAIRADTRGGKTLASSSRERTDDHPEQHG